MILKKNILTINIQSTQITKLYFLLGLFLIMNVISSKAIFACGISTATLWVGDTTEQAENHNTSIVYRPKDLGFGWHIHWIPSPPEDYVEGYIWDITEDFYRSTCWGYPEEREDSGAASYLPGQSVGPHIIKAKIHKVGSESWYWSNPRTVVYVAVGKVRAYFNGNWYDADEDNIFVVLKGTKCTFKAFPNPSTASWPSYPNPTPSWQFDGQPLNPSGEDTKEITFDDTIHQGLHSLRARCGPYDDGKYYTINVIVPEPDQVSFVDCYDDEEHDIYNITDPVWKRVDNPDDPASYTKDNYIKVEAKFWNSSDLTFPTGVHVDVVGIDWGTFTEDTTVTFGGWPSEKTTHTCEGKLTKFIATTTPILVWSYKVPSGTNTPIPMAADSGPHKIFQVYGAPKCDFSNYTEDNINDAVGKALDESTESDIASKANTTVGDDVYEGCICNDGFQKNFDAAMDEYPPPPPPPENKRGMCCCRAEGLDCVLNVLGIGPYTNIYCNEMPESTWATSKHRCLGWCTTHGPVTRAFRAGSIWNRWQGAVRSGGTGTTAYSPTGDYEDDHDGIADNWTYRWHYGSGANDYCTGACTVNGFGSCIDHSSYWDRFLP